MKALTPVDPKERPTVAIPALQVPYPTRVVMYNFRALNGTILSRPMMITSSKNEIVNGTVFFEAGDGGPPDGRVVNVPIHDEGPYMPGTWSWPERKP